MGTTQSNNLAQSPDSVPISDKDTGKVNFIWNQWFTNVQIKLNTITAAIIALSKNATAGFLASDGIGGIFSRTLTAGTGITITNPTGAGGNPVISVSGGAGGSPMHVTTNTATSYTVQLTDAPASTANVGWIDSQNSSANTINLDTNVNVAFPIGTDIYVCQGGIGQTTINAKQGVNFTGASITPAGQYGIGRAVQVAVNTWRIFGNLAFTNFSDTWNPADISPNLTLSAGNLTATIITANTWSAVRAIISYSSGKYYFEVLIGSTAGNIMPGCMDTTALLTNYVGADVHGWSYDGVNGYTYHGGVGAIFGATYTTGDVIGIAIDLTTGYIWFAKNNVWQASGNPATGANPAFTGITGTIFPAGSTFDGSSAFTGRFTLAEQSYAPPTGFSAWN